MSDAEIKVSVIVPVYNAEKYLEQCLDSIVNQTLKEIEIICVDDGSTDSSGEILRRYAGSDSRFLILHQENQYAGTARNLGKSRARGKYLVFWDSDDYFMENALEAMYAQCEKDEADLCICSGRQYYDDLGYDVPVSHYVKEKCLPEVIPFNRKDCPETILNITIEAPWNKMFRRAFIEEEGLNFKQIRNANDVFFVECAICLAKRITVLNEALICYRHNTGISLMSTVSKAPEDAIRTWVETAEYLRERDIFPRRSFANRAISSIILLLHSMTDWNAFRSGVVFLQSGALESLALTIHEPGDGYYDVDWQAIAVKNLYEQSPEEFLTWLCNIAFLLKKNEGARRRHGREKDKETIKHLKEKNASLKRENIILKEKEMGLIDPLEAPEPIHQYITIKYNSSKKKDVCTSSYSLVPGTLEITKSGNYEYALKSKVMNGGTYILQENQFIPAEDQKKRIFAGWQLRKKKKNIFVWLNEEGNWVEKTKETQESLKIFLPRDAIPVIEDSNILIACAVWE